MKRVTVFLSFFLILISFGFVGLESGDMQTVFSENRLLILCILTGGLGSIIYCLRAVYINYCVEKSWDEIWIPWYFIRPLVGLAMGGVAFIFLKAGLLVLEAEPAPEATNFGYLALSFIAGYKYR